MSYFMLEFLICVGANSVRPVCLLDTPGDAVAGEESPPTCSVGPSPNRKRSAPADSGIGWKSELLPQVASLFLPGSLLVSENLKVRDNCVG